jgi:chromosome segregation ATPase
MSPNPEKEKDTEAMTKLKDKRGGLKFTLKRLAKSNKTLKGQVRGWEDQMEETMKQLNAKKVEVRSLEAELINLTSNHRGAVERLNSSKITTSNVAKDVRRVEAKIQVSLFF